MHLILLSPLSRIKILSNFPQPAKIESPILVKDDGIVICVSDKHELVNAERENLVHFLL